MLLWRRKDGVLWGQLISPGGEGLKGFVLVGRVLTELILVKPAERMYS
jgi:hypothetical protein